MRLRKAQREQLLAWIADGLTSDEINKRGADFEPPFSVTRPQVTYWRNKCKVDIEQLIADGKHRALNEGLATKAERVRRLQELARLLQAELLEDKLLWLPQVKSIGSGKDARAVDYEVFNRAEIEAYRGLLDDIARELGHRVKGIDLDVSGSVTLVGIDPDE